MLLQLNEPDSTGMRRGMATETDPCPECNCDTGKVCVSPWFPSNERWINLYCFRCGHHTELKETK